MVIEMLYEYYGQQMNTVERKAYHVALHAMEQLKDSVMMLGIYDKEHLLRIITNIKFDHPELFYVDFTTILFCSTPLGTKYSIRFIYDKKSIQRCKDEFNRLVSESIRLVGLNDNDSDIIKHKKIHNYVLKNFSYHDEAFNNPERFRGSFEAYSTLRDKRGVCEGLSKVYKLFCDQNGLKAYIIEGKSSLEGLGKNIGHAWNICEMNVGACHLDVTWDMALSRVCSYNRYDYFCIPDEWIRTDHDFFKTTDCHTDELSYFSINKRIITKKQQLEEYVKDSIVKNQEVLYFKIKGKIDNRPLDNQHISEVDSSVQQYMAKYLHCNYQYLKTWNANQGVFFYRIMKG